VAKEVAGQRDAELSPMPTLRAVLIGLIFVLTLAAMDGARAASSDWVSEAHGAARLISAVEATGAGARLDVGLQLHLTPGWHTYWRTPGDAGIAPAIDWSGSENLAGAAIAWPAPRRLPSVGGLETVGYEDGVVLPITVTPMRPGAPLHLHAEVCVLQGYLHPLSRKSRLGAAARARTSRPRSATDCSGRRRGAG
jgi:DsbC/DsbD-like thiol-disulfide interchange protein